MSETPNNLAAYIWSLADLLRGDFKQSQYGRIILPFILLRRLECVLEGSKESVLAEYEKVQHMNLPEEAQEKLLLHATGGLSFFNTSKMDLSKLGEAGLKDNLESYIQGFSQDVREVIEYFRFDASIGQLNDANLLHEVVQKVCLIDLSPKSISNHDMGKVFDRLIRLLAESSNEAAGEHFTPRDILHLTTSLVFMEDDDVLTKPGIIRTIYDPTAGTGGFLSEGMEYVEALNPQAVIRAFGQELNSEAYAICKAGMLIKGQDVSNIKLGNTLSNDQLYGNKFDYMLSHPPFGMNWKNIQSGIKDEHTIKGFDGRFGAGLPGVSDSSLLFLMHLISKLRDETQGGGRIGIILNGSPLVSGGAGSGESEIRRYILEADLLETIISLPTDMFYNTGIATYIWVLSNKKAEERRGKVQLINGVNFYRKMRKSTGSKRNEISEECVSGIIESHGNCEEDVSSIIESHENFEEDVSSIIESHENFEEDVAGISKIFNTSDFGYRRITIEHPLRLRFSVNAESLNSYKSIEGVKYIEAFTAIEHGNIFDSLESFLKAANVTELSDSTTNSIINCFANRHSDGEPVINSDGDILPDVKLRRYEDVPLNQGIYDYFSREISPSTPDAWIDESKRDKNDGEVGVVGYEINFQRIKMNTQMERLETQYKNYTVTNLGRLAQEFNRVSLARIIHKKGVNLT